MRKVIKGSWVIAAAVAGVVSMSASGRSGAQVLADDTGNTTKRPGVLLADDTGNTTKRPGVVLA